MARPIKPTPILYGKDAIRFEEKMKTPRPLFKERVEEMNQAVEMVGCLLRYYFFKNLAK